MAAKSRFSMARLRENSSLPDEDELQQHSKTTVHIEQEFLSPHKLFKVSSCALSIMSVSDKGKFFRPALTQLHTLTCGFFLHSRRHWRYSASTSFCKPDRRIMQW